MGELHVLLGAKHGLEKAQAEHRPQVGARLGPIATTATLGLLTEAAAPKKSLKRSLNWLKMSPISEKPAPPAPSTPAWPNWS